MATLHILDDAEFERIAALLADGQVVLVPRSLIEGVKQTEAELTRRAIEYDSTDGTPTYVDLVDGLDHFFFCRPNDA